jgi:hypothetical protein
VHVIDPTQYYNYGESMHLDYVLNYEEHPWVGEALCCMISSLYIEGHQLERDMDPYLKD